MAQEDIVNSLKKIIQQYLPEPELVNSIADDADLMQDLKINSAHLVDIILDIEEAFDIEISDEDADQMLKVKDAISIIQKRLDDGRE